MIKNKYPAAAQDQVTTNNCGSAPAAAAPLPLTGEDIRFLQQCDPETIAPQNIRCLCDQALAAITLREQLAGARAENANFRQHYVTKFAYNVVTKAREQAERELAEARKDAERYRLVLERLTQKGGLGLDVHGWIDAAMKEQK